MWNHSKQNFSKEQSDPDTKIPLRGRIRCWRKSGLRERKGSEPCPFGITYKWAKNEQVYIIVSASFDHNHCLGCDNIKLDGRVVINLQSDLTVNQFNTIEFIALSQQPMPNMKLHLESQFVGRPWLHNFIDQEDGKIYPR